MVNNTVSCSPLLLCSPFSGVLIMYKKLNASSGPINTNSVAAVATLASVGHIRFFISQKLIKKLKPIMSSLDCWFVILKAMMENINKYGKNCRMEIIKPGELGINVAKL